MAPEKYKPVLEPDCRCQCGGGGGIRTHGRLSPTSVFKTGAFDHSATPPTGRRLSDEIAILKAGNHSQLLPKRFLRLSLAAGCR